MKNNRIFFKILLIITIFLTHYIYCDYAYGKDLIETTANNYSKLIKQANLYCDKGDIDNAIINYEKLAEAQKNEQNLNKLGLLHFINYDYNKALNCFKASLELNPQNRKTRIKVEITQNLINSQNENEKINQLSPNEIAPKKVHKLIRVEGKLKNKESEKKLHKIIDFIWSDPQGKLLIKNALKTNVEICLKENIKYSSSMLCEFNMYETYKNYYGGNPTLKGLPTYNIYFISIKEKDIKNFQEQNSTKLDNERAIMVVAHELHHLLMEMNYIKPTNSRQEEALCTIQGYEIASRVLKGEQITEDELKSNISIFLNGIKYNDAYKGLGNENDAIRKMTALGVLFPHLSLCQNLHSIDYKVIKLDPFVNGYVQKLGSELNKNYESIFTNKKVYYKKKIFLVKNNAPKIYVNYSNKYSKIEDREDIFNIMIEQSKLVFPYEIYKGTVIPILITRNDNNIKLNTLSTK